MFKKLLTSFAKFVFSLRYRVTLRGQKEVAENGRKGILFVANHPALIDPPIVCTWLQPVFNVNPLGKEDEINRPGVRFLARQIEALPFPNLSQGSHAEAAAAETKLNEIGKTILDGENVLLYPSGHIYKSRYESCRGNSAVERVLQHAPDCRIVMVKTTGLWGSFFSMASGKQPVVASLLKRGIGLLLKNGIFFMPRRHVSITLKEAEDFPRDKGRKEMNQYLESFFNEEAPPNTYVPYTWWDGQRKTLPDPDFGHGNRDISQVPNSVKEQVLAHLKEEAGTSKIAPQADLSQDLGLDSLAKMNLITWLGEEYGVFNINIDSLYTVADVMLAACGHASSDTRPKLTPVENKWFDTSCSGNLPKTTDLNQDTLASVFRKRAQQTPDMPIVADQMSGVKTYRDMVRGINALAPTIRDLPGERVGILLPASVAATTAYYAVLFSGKTPVFFNWTVGLRNLKYGIKQTECEAIISSNKMLKRLSQQGIDLSSLPVTLHNLEDIAASLSITAKLRGMAASIFTHLPSVNTSQEDTAAILFTSGSETLPKAVPLSHGNLLANIADVETCLSLNANDKLTAILPPFHSFGLLGNVVLPVLFGVPSTYYPNPTDGMAIADIISHYKTTILIGTPTFLNGIVQNSVKGQLDTLKTVLTGAEKCSRAIYDLINKKCPQITVLEAYGITECSPAISINPQSAPQPETIGKILPSMEYAIVDRELQSRVKRGEEGRLLVRGPNVFSGYLPPTDAKPFVALEDKQWYDTGDVVSEAADGYLRFCGRQKRFVKMGGEMISLPAIENILSDHFPNDEEGHSTFAVEDLGLEGHPEIVLFTTQENTEREKINQIIKANGFSALHNIRRVQVIDEMPLLGSGKIHYRKLKEMGS